METSVANACKHTACDNDMFIDSLRLRAASPWPTTLIRVRKLSPTERLMTARSEG
jgi:hypothetical protein